MWCPALAVNETLTAALLDRLFHHSNALKIWDEMDNIKSGAILANVDAVTAA